MLLPYENPAGLPLSLRVKVGAITTAYKGPWDLAMWPLGPPCTSLLLATLASAVPQTGQSCTGLLALHLPSLAP